MRAPTATTESGIPAANVQTALAVLAERHPDLLFELLGLDMAGMTEIFDDAPDCFELILTDRLGLLLAGHPTWLPTPDDEA